MSASFFPPVTPAPGVCPGGGVEMSPPGPLEAYNAAIGLSLRISITDPVPIVDPPKLASDADPPATVAWALSLGVGRPIMAAGCIAPHGVRPFGRNSWIGGPKWATWKWKQAKSCARL